MDIPLLEASVKLIITDTHGRPAVEIRRYFSDLKDVKLLISAAHHGTALAIFPTFPDRLKSLSNLVEKGYLTISKEKYLWNI